MLIILLFCMIILLNIVVADKSPKAVDYNPCEEIMPYVLNTYNRSIRYCIIVLPDSKSCNE